MRTIDSVERCVFFFRFWLLLCRLLFVGINSVCIKCVVHSMWDTCPRLFTTSTQTNVCRPQWRHCHTMAEYACLVQYAIAFDRVYWGLFARNHLSMLGFISNNVVYFVHKIRWLDCRWTYKWFTSKMLCVQRRMRNDARNIIPSFFPFFAGNLELCQRHQMHIYFNFVVAKLWPDGFVWDTYVSPFHSRNPSSNGAAQIDEDVTSFCSPIWGPVIE